MKQNNSPNNTQNDDYKSQKWDVLIVGGGHNGLVAGCYLQKSGLKCLVLERSDIVGGAAVSRSLFDGYTYTNCSYVNSLFRPKIMRDLALAEYGLQVIPYETSVMMLEDGGYFGAYFGDHDAMRREIKRFSPIDCDQYDIFSNFVARQCQFIKPLLERNAPDPLRFAPRDIDELLYVYKRAYNLGARELSETYRFYTASVADFMAQFFSFEPLRAMYCANGIIGTGLGVFSPGTAYVLLHHFMGEVDGTVAAWGFSRGGMGSVSKALKACFEAHGGRVAVDSEVIRFICKNQQCVGAVLKDGTEVHANRVVSGMDVRRTMAQMVDNAQLPDEYLRYVKEFKFRGSSGKLNIALKSEPQFGKVPKSSKLLRGNMYSMPSVMGLEKAYIDWKYGNWSQEPYAELLLPSYIDPTMAPQGGFTATAFIQYCPYELSGGREWTAENKQAFADSVLNKIGSYSPDFRDNILHMEVRTPLDIENEVGLTEGNIFQGELTLDQLYFNRPVPGYSDYRTPIKGLYIVGSSTHPGGGVMGAPGYNGAREILRELKP